jgi:hypothetical protein
MSLHDTYAKAWIEDRGLPTGWIVNLEPAYNLALGAVGIVDGQDFNAETSLALRGVTGLQLDPDQRRTDNPWQFHSNNGISVRLSSAGVTTVPGEVGKAGWKLNVKFGSHAGASVHGAAMWWNGYADLGVVRARIVEAAKSGRLHEGESIVVAQQLTGSGVLFLAKGTNASLTAAVSAKLNAAALPPISSLAGQLTVTKSSGGAQSQAFADGTVLAARLLYLGHHGWLWWRRFEAQGAFPLSDQEIEEATMKPVEGDGLDEYFALL